MLPPQTAAPITCRCLVVVPTTALVGIVESNVTSRPSIFSGRAPPAQVVGEIIGVTACPHWSGVSGV